MTHQEMMRLARSHGSSYYYPYADGRKKFVFDEESDASSFLRDIRRNGLVIDPAVGERVEHTWRGIAVTFKPSSLSAGGKRRHAPSKKKLTSALIKATTELRDVMNAARHKIRRHRLRAWL